MYKIGIKEITKFKNSINKTSKMLIASHEGAKLHPKEVEKLIESNNKLLKLIKDNYYV